MPTMQRTRGDEGKTVPSVRWRVVEIAPDAQTARLVPYLPWRALARRLDATFGRGGWANRLVPFGSHAVVGELTIEGLTKSAVVHGVSGAGSPEEWAAAALNEAAALHGIELPLDAAAEAWVDWDAETGEPLWWPEATTATSDGPAGATERDDAIEMPVAEPEPPADAAPIRSEGQRAIDKLMDRLREAGHGLEAAKLVNDHRGYGSDPDEARALYARLRQLLLEGPTS